MARWHTLCVASAVAQKKPSAVVSARYVALWRQPKNVSPAQLCFYASLGSLKNGSAAHACVRPGFLVGLN